MIDGANSATTATKAREGGNNPPARGQSRRARSIPYADLLPGSRRLEIRAKACRGRRSAPTAGPGHRRGVSYTISVGVCSSTTRHEHERRAASQAGSAATGSGQTTAAQCAAILGPSGSGGSNPDCGTDGNRDGEVDGLVAGDAAVPGRRLRKQPRA
jgi:hypothetical protein